MTRMLRKLRSVKSRRRSAAAQREEWRAMAKIGASGLFFANWYLRTNNDVAEENVDPLWHFVHYGWREMRDPCPDFSVRWYLETYPDVAAEGMNPVIHYIEHGWREGRNPSDSFDTNANISAYPDALSRNVNPLTQYYEDRLLSGSTLRKVTPESFPVVVKFSELDLRTGYSPLISILLPTYKTEPRFIHDVLRSIRNQNYPLWELCIVDDASNDERLLTTLRDAVAADPRIKLKVRDRNGGIAAASQDALDMATGEFVAFVDHDDMLTEDALGSVVEVLRNDSSIDFIYSDHVMISEDGKVTHVALKPDWSPEFFLSTNYIVHFKVMRRTIVNAIGGFGGETSIVQDIGMTCRVIEHGARIHHLPKVLYSWRDHPKSVASGTRAKVAIEHLAMQTYDQHLQRRGIPAIMEWPNYFRERNIGAYKLRFQQVKRSAALIVVDPNGTEDIQRWQASVASLMIGQPTEVHAIRTNSAHGTARVASTKFIGTAKGLTDFVTGIDAELIIFAPGTGRPINDDWAAELLGYFDVDTAIGVIGGKLLDYNLSVRGGGFRLIDHAELIGFNHSDNFDGYWYTSRLASNVMAVSAGLMATRRDLFLAAGGIDPTLDASSAGLAYCRAVRQKGYRVVYNPWAKIVDPYAGLIPGRVERDENEQDSYYHPDFSRKVLYTHA